MIGQNSITVSYFLILFADFLGLESCIAAKSFVDSYSICTAPYIAALSDKTADVCQ